ncbi:nuclear transport factor 2 family protein [Frateuria sp. MAH-13]|uniref:Nuclear transport factor 2 family protein n=1 Tax=Frateuria flava TaxID=2821489 RepID=A0ABS4DK64_9GAMM|nr:nuclear transport factor 2 family protein [Frateuria flava]MBP1473437.1 nuclear transport factor 2 family protein [Frateuria flava]
MRPVLLQCSHAVQRAALLAALVLTCGAAQADSTASPASVLKPVHAFFDAMARHDQAAMRAQVLPAGTATLMREGKPVQLTLGEFVDHVKPGKEKIEERIGHPQVLVDRDLAVVWAPYTFLLDGKPHHCGTDVFNLVRVDGRWRIAAIADNSGKCAP